MCLFFGSQGEEQHRLTRFDVPMTDGRHRTLAQLVLLPQNRSVYLYWTLWSPWSPHLHSKLPQATGFESVPDDRFRLRDVVWTTSETRHPGYSVTSDQ